MSSLIRIKQGLRLPIAGTPASSIEPSPTVRQVALVGDDYIGMKPTMAVETGDRVRLGSLLFTDKKTPGVRYTSPGAGTVVAIHRGAKRKFLSLVIELEGDDEETFAEFSDTNLQNLDRSQAQENLVASGLWTALRVRPYGKVPVLGSVPHSLFVTAIDTHPLAAQPGPIIAARQHEFVAGLEVLSTLTDGPIHLCGGPDDDLPGQDVRSVNTVTFAGPHPAGLPGTHIHFLDPVCATKTVWHIGYQDVIAIGQLFLTGRLLSERVISLAGPMVENPRLIRSRLGASLTDLLHGQTHEGECRVISGSVFSGRESVLPCDYLSRYDLQVSVIGEGRAREFLGWLRPGWGKFSIKPAFAAALGGGQSLPFSTSTQGSPRAIVPIGMYEKVFPLDLLATPLLKALVSHDTENAQALGCLELVEEDLALCTYACPGKHEFGPILRQQLSRIEAEG